MLCKIIKPHFFVAFVQDDWCLKLPPIQFRSYNCNKTNVTSNLETYSHLPSIISCFILAISFLNSLTISFLRVSSSVGPRDSCEPSDNPFTFKIVSSEAEPNLFLMLFGDSENFEVFAGKVFVFSHIAFFSSSSLSTFFSAYVKKQTAYREYENFIWSKLTAALLLAKVFAISSIIEAILPPPPRPKVP